MTSSVFFKFKSQKEPSRIEFDGTGISVFEVKREIITLSGLGDGKNFDLKVYNEEGMEEYDDDTTIIPRSTTIIARRLPAVQPGKGNAARYVTGNMPGNVKNASRKEHSIKPKAKSVTTNGNIQINDNMTEEEKMAAMFQASSDAWSAQQENLASLNTGNPRAGGPKKGQPSHVPDHEPPQGYICYRCGEKGHWIQVCPTNDDPNFANKPRVKRTTGIPKSFLKTIEKPAALGANDGTVDDTKGPTSVMVNADGEYVVAKPDEASWVQFQAKTKSSAAAQKAAALGEKELQDRGLECSIDKRIFIDPMKTPCCKKTYCNECITNALIESDFTCPACQTDGVLIDDLKPDDEATAKIKVYLEEKNTALKEKEVKNSPKSPLVKPESPPAANVKVKVKTPLPGPKSPAAKKTPSPEKSKTLVKDDGAASKNKKRPADELLENPKIPKAPKAMQMQQNAQQLKKQQEAMMNGMMNGGMPGLPNMPFDMSQTFFAGMPNMNMMNGFGMGMPNPMMGGMSPMMGMNGMNGFGGGFGMNGMGNMFAGNGMMGNMGMMNGGGPHMNGNTNGHGHGGSFPNQLKTVFAEPLPNEEDNAYFRKPVNPHRHQGRQRRARPSDYREL